MILTNKNCNFQKVPNLLLNFLFLLVSGNKEKPTENKTSDQPSEQL
jgi:hypothetical protein